MNNSRLITQNLDYQFKHRYDNGMRRDINYTGNQIVPVERRLPKMSMKTSLVPNYGFKKNAVVGGYGDVKTTDPMIRNPLLNVINFYLPERREILNQWIRYYDRFDPLVGNCIDLHAMVPFSKFSFSGIDDKSILQFYEDMAIDMHLLKRIFEISREYELIGEVFPFCHWSHEKNCFDDMIILNPDFVNVRGVQQAGKDNYTLELIPDPEMRAMINSQNVEDLLLVSKLDPELVYAVQNNMNIQLDGFNVEPVMRKQNPYDQRGTAITLRCLKDLMYKDKLREAQTCLKPGTDVLTTNGWKHIEDVTLEDKVATYNKDTDEILFDNPTHLQNYDFDGDLINFKSRRINFTCTPNHRCLIKNCKNKIMVKEAKDVKHTYYFKTNGNNIGPFIDVPGYVEITHEGPRSTEIRKIKIEDFLEFAGYFVSEGHVSKIKVKPENFAKSKKNYQYSTGISQKVGTKKRKKIEDCLRRLPFPFQINDKNHSMVNGSTCLNVYMEKEFGKGHKGKKIPTWIKNLPIKYLQIFIDAAVLGDGNVRQRKNVINICYGTTSKQLAEDMQEIVWKCGYNVSMNGFQNKDFDVNGEQYAYCYTIRWNPDKTYRRYVRVDSKKNIRKEYYNGKVYCLSVPSTFFVTRQGGRIVIHGNSVAEGKITPYQIWKLGDPANGYLPSSEDLEDFRALLQAGKGDMDYNIITHHGLEVEFVGLNGKLLPIIPEMEFINKQIMVALFTNESFVMGNGPNFSTASVAMRVYQARYESKRDLILDYLMRKVFMPVAMANEFYQRSQADLAHNVRTKNDQRRLIIPEFRWEGKVNLVDDPQKIQFLIQLRQMGLPLDPILDMMGLDKEQILKQIDAEERTKLSLAQVQKRLQPPNPFGGMFGGSPVGGGLGTQPQAGMPRPGGIPPVGSMPKGTGDGIKNEQAAENKQFHKEQTLAELLDEKKN